MAREPSDMVLRSLQDIQTTLGEHSRKLDELTVKFDRMEATHADTERLALLALGSSTDSRLKIRELARRVDEAFGRIEELEGQP
jgi:hypothetical protein